MAGKQMKMDVGHSFANRLSELMTFYQVRPEELAADSRINIKDLIAWLDGKGPTVDRAVDRAAAALGVSVAYLLSGLDERYMYRYWLMSRLEIKTPRQETRRNLKQSLLIINARRSHHY